MPKGRLEAFSDGVIAILITIMVFELHTPAGTSWHANLHLLFWLSLVPFTTAWMSEHRFPATPTAVYGIVLLAAAIAYLILQTTLLRAEGEHSGLRVALGSDAKGKVSALL